MSDDDKIKRPRAAADADADMAERLRGARELLGLSQQDVAAALRVPRSTISDIETSKRRVTAAELREMANLYRLDYGYLLEGKQPQDDMTTALFRATRGLSDNDKAQVLRFAKFLSSASKPPSPVGDEQ